MGVAEVLATLRERINGTVVFIFQPAEEGPPSGEEGGASLMIKEGALKDPAPNAIFGLHLNSRTPLGKAGVRSGSFMASGDTFRIVVNGSQTHAALPWLGIDPIVLSSQVIQGIQTIESRQVNVLLEPSVISIGVINGGNRPNIIPDKVEMSGMIRALDETMRNDIQ
jgi:amidohydrolase